MLLTLLVASLVTAALWIPATGVAQGLDGDPCVDSDVQPVEDEVTVPTDQYRSIQSGVCGLVDGGTLHVLPGSYSGPIVVWGKQVRIAGDGTAEDWPTIQMAPPVTVVDPEDAVGVVTVGEDAGLVLDKARIVGGDAGILGLPGSGSIDIKQVVIEQSGRGILHLSAGDLSVKHFVVEDTLWNGISLAPVNLEAENCGEMDVKHGLLGAQGGAGIYIRGCPFGESFGLNKIEDLTLLSPQGGGIVAIGTIVEIDQVFIPSGRYWGMLLVNTFASVERSTILGIDEGPIFDPDTGQYSNRWGDGITVFSSNLPSTLGAWPPPSNVFVDDLYVFGVDRAGLALFGGTLTVRKSSLFNVAFDLQVEDNDGYQAHVSDGGGNLCGDPTAIRKCIAESIGFAPPAFVPSS